KFVPEIIYVFIQLQRDMQVTLMQASFKLVAQQGACFLSAANAVQKVQRHADPFRRKIYGKQVIHFIGGLVGMKSRTEYGSCNSVVKRWRMNEAKVVGVSENRFITRLPQFRRNIFCRRSLTAFAQVFHPPVSPEKNAGWFRGSVLL